MAAAVELFEGKNGDWYFRVKAGNGEIVLKGSEGYASGEAGARKGVASGLRALSEAVEADNIKVVEN